MVNPKGTDCMPGSPTVPHQPSRLSDWTPDQSLTHGCTDDRHATVRHSVKEQVAGRGHLLLAASWGSPAVWSSRQSMKSIASVGKGWLSTSAKMPYAPCSETTPWVQPLMAPPRSQLKICARSGMRACAAQAASACPAAG
jgi:hypothetical protein